MGCPCAKRLSRHLVLDRFLHPALNRFLHLALNRFLHLALKLRRSQVLHHPLLPLLAVHYFLPFYPLHPLLNHLQDQYRDSWGQLLLLVGAINYLHREGLLLEGLNLLW